MRMQLKIAVVSCLALAAVGCANLEKYTQQGEDFVSKYSTEAKGLMQGNQSLGDRLAKLPTTMAGVSEATADLTKNRDAITGIQNELGGFRTNLDGAIKKGDEGAVTSMLEQQKTTTTTGLASASTGLQSLTERVTALETESAKVAAKPAMPAAPPMFNKALASGYAVSGNPTGIEAQLIAFIEDSGRPVDKTTWFNFDRLLFKTGSAELDMEQSKAQLTNVAEIMKAYPKVSMKLGGYTDNQGNAVANKKLSTERANSVTKALVAMGIAKTRLSPEGYGAEHPVCPANDTDECRAQNRRISVRVSGK